MVDSVVSQKTNLPRLMTGEEVAEVLIISKAFAFKLIRQGKIPGVRMGRSVRIRPDDLQKYIQEQVTREPYPS